MTRKQLWLAIGLALSACAHAPAGEQAAASLVAAERAFAVDASVRSVNEAFLAVLADNATLFRPAPVAGRAALAQRPMAATLLLEWAPTYAEVSADGSLGFDTGPSRSGQRGQPPAATGWFISVWRRIDGVWKLETDCGISAPIPAAPDSVTHLLKTHANSRSFRDQTSLVEVERMLINDYKAQFAQRAAENVRVYRNGHAPTDTRAAALALIASDSPAAYTLYRVGVAGSGDLGYAVGVQNPQAAQPRGYERIYRRERDGVWKVAVDWRN